MTPSTTNSAVLEVATIYLNPTAREVLTWLRSSRCSWCGHNCKSGSCRARHCDGCSSIWLADTEAEYREFDSGGQATVGPAEEVCEPCRAWFANLHLDSEAPQFTPGDWMVSDAVADYRLERMKGQP